MFACYLTNMLFILILELASTDFTRDSNECKTWAKQNILLTDNSSAEAAATAIVKCNEFSDLNHSCTQSVTPFNIRFLYLYQTREILIDNNIDLRNILNMFQFSLKPYIAFHKLKGFNQVPTKTRPINLFENYTITLMYSKFAFYKNGTLVSPTNCTYKNFNSKMDSFFGSMEIIFHEFSSQINLFRWNSE